MLGINIDAWGQAIDDFSDYLHSYRECRDGTVRLRRCHLRALARAHVRRTPWKVSADDLARWLAEQGWGSRNTRDSYRASIRTFYAWAVKAGRIKRSPAEDLTGGARVRSMPEYVPEKALKSALAMATDRDRLILVLGAYAGLRRGEIAGLRWDDDRITHLWVTGKGGHQRSVTRRGIVGNELDAEHARRGAGDFGTGYRYRNHPDSLYVFPGRDGRAMSPEAIGRAAKAALRGRYTTHALRHRFGTISYATSRDLRGVQKLLGHSSPSITEIYTHLSDESLDAIVEGIQPGHTD